MKGYWLYIVVLALLISAYVLAQYYRPKPVDWSPSYSLEDKIPLGTYILYHELSQIFPAADPTSVRESTYELLSQNTDTNSVYIFIDDAVSFSNADRDALINFVKKGNHVFIAANDIGKTLTDTLHCKIDHLLSGSGKTATNLVNKKLPRRNFLLDSAVFATGIIINDTAKTIVLGEINEEPNFVRFDIGKGDLYLNVLPLAFSNYYLLKKHFLAYASASLSYLPAHPQQLYWDEFFKKGRIGATTPLRVVLAHPDLKWAYWLAIVSLIIFVFFEGKRRQRIIPEIKPLHNATLEFVSTVAQLYYSRRDNKNISGKKVNYWMAFLRGKYRINEEDQKQDFVTVVAAKSGVEEKQIQELWHLILEINTSTTVDDQRLMKLNQLLEIFYQKVNR